MADRMTDYKSAQSLLLKLIEKLGHFCLRIEITGDARRTKEKCKRLELIAIPDPDEASNLYSKLTNMTQRRIGVDNKFVKIYYMGRPVSINITTQEEWACKMIERTGSEEFYRRLSMAIVKAGYIFHSNRLWSLKFPVDYPAEAELNVPVTCFDERDIFRNIGLNYIEPSRREF